MTELDVKQVPTNLVLPQFEVTNELLEKAAKYVMDSKTYYESQRQAWSDRLRELDRADRCILEEDRPYHGLSDKSAPIIHDNVQTVKARLKEAIIPTDKDLVELDAPQMNPQVSQYRTDELNYQLEKQDIEDKIDKVCDIVSKFGTFFIKEIYTEDTHQVLTQQLVVEPVQTPIIDDNNEPILDVNGQPMVLNEQKQSLQIIPKIDRKYFGPSYMVVDDIEDIYGDMFIEDIQNQPIVIHRIFTNWEDLLQGIESGVYLEGQVAKIKDMTTSSPIGLASKRSQDVLTSTGYLPNIQSSGKPKVYELCEAYCDFAIPARGEDGKEYEQIYSCTISVIGNICIGLRPNGYFHQMKPILKGVYKRHPGEFYGTGAINPVLDLFHEYNDTMNQINDAKVLSLNPIKIQKVGSIADQTDLDIEPGITWYEKNTGDIRFAQFDFSRSRMGCSI